MVVGGWGYDQDELWTGIVDPFESSLDCVSNEVILQSSDKIIGNNPVVTNGKYVCTSNECYTLSKPQMSNTLLAWEYVDLNMPKDFYVWYGSASVVTSEFWWITNGWRNEPNRKTILLYHLNEDFFNFGLPYYGWYCDRNLQC